MNQGFFLLYFLVWGSAVVADLDQFSKADVPCICLSRSCRYGTHFYYLSWLCNHYRQPAFKWCEPCCLKNDWDPGQCSSRRPLGDWSDRWSLSIVQRVASTLARVSGLGEANQAPKQNMLYPSCLHLISLHAILLHSGNPTTCHEANS
jgi:hypothetical protein